MNVKDLEKLLAAVADADLNEFMLETGDYKLTLKRGGVQVIETVQVTPAVAASPQVASAVVVASEEPKQAATEPLAEEPAAAEPSNFIEVTAPIVGTFYEASSPEAPAYAKVGDKVKAGTVLCIIEAMKLMNEIEAESSGTIAEILVSNADPVEYGQVLFRIDPS